MSLPTTCLGAFPKPSYSPVSDWFEPPGDDLGGEVTRRHNTELESLGEHGRELLARATADAIADQVACGIDVPTDGEHRRENYVHYHCRHLEGFDFTNLTTRTMRNGAFVSDVPTVVSQISARPGHFLPDDWSDAQQHTDRPVKITVPGPLTIIGTVADVHYRDDAALVADLADALNHEIRALAGAGCTHIQVDEPVFARTPDAALEIGVEGLERCFAGIGPEVTRAVHICCGYPMHLDDDAYEKADPAAYHRLAPALDELECLDQISIEDAHRHNDLELLERFGRTTVVLGSIAIASSRIETADEIADRLRRALEHIDRDRLVVAPDCGLGFLSRDQAMAKLRAMTGAAAAV